MSSPDPTAPAEAPDPSVTLAEQRLLILRDLTELGMELAREVVRKAKADADLAEAAAASGEPLAVSPAGGRESDPADRFAKVSRAVRLTLTLEARTDEALRALRAGVEVEVKARRAEAVRHGAEQHEQRRHDRRIRVRNLVLEV